LFQFAPQTAGQPDFFATPQSIIDQFGARDRLWAGTLGGTNVTYQWRLNGTTIPGATGTSLVLSNLNLASVGLYDVVVTSGSFAMTSSIAPVSLLGIVAAGRQSPVITIDGVVGSSFGIDSNTNLVNAPWNTLTNFTLSARHMEIHDPAANNTPARFYRVNFIPPYYPPDSPPHLPPGTQEP
jgi:hypothetical protein